MKTLQRTAILVLVMALVAVPTVAFAIDDATVTTETDRDTGRADRDRPVDRPEHDLSDIKNRALETIESQLGTLSRLRSKIAASGHITDAHGIQLLGDIATAAQGLESLARQITAATTLEALRGLIEHIGDYKIKQVLGPKTHQVIASDTLVYAIGKLERYAEKLTEVVARFEEAGFVVDEALRLLEGMKINLSEGYRLAGPVAANVIGLQPGDWPDPAQSVLGAGRASLGEARQNVRGAHSKGKQIVEFLRGLHDRTDAATDVARTSPAPSDIAPTDG